VELPAAFVDGVVVGEAHHGEVSEHGGRGPGVDVVGVEEAGGGAGLEAAVAVSAHDDAAHAGADGA